MRRTTEEYLASASKRGCFFVVVLGLEAHPDLLGLNRGTPRPGDPVKDLPP